MNCLRAEHFPVLCVLTTLKLMKDKKLEANLSMVASRVMAG